MTKKESEIELVDYCQMSQFEVREVLLRMLGELEVLTRMIVDKGKKHLMIKSVLRPLLICENNFIRALNICVDILEYTDEEFRRLECPNRATNNQNKE